MLLNAWVLGVPICARLRLVTIPYLVMLVGMNYGSAAGAAARCSLSHLEFCTDTNELVWSQAFESAVRRFLGDRRANYLYGRGRVSDQAIDVLGGPPDRPTKIGRFWRFTACRAHSCSEKGAAVIAPNGEIEALAILHSDCAEVTRPTDCFAHDTLTIFTRSLGPSPSIVENLSIWAKTKADEEYHPPSLPATHLDRTEVITVADGK